MTTVFFTMQVILESARLLVQDATSHSLLSPMRPTGQYVRVQKKSLSYNQDTTLPSVWLGIRAMHQSTHQALNTSTHVEATRQRHARPKAFQKIRRKKS